MGMGMVVIVDKTYEEDALSLLNKSCKAYKVGTVEEGIGVKIPSLDIHI
jgi:phosphoribosylaminoimidazole (AIR) synthetase